MLQIVKFYALLLMFVCYTANAIEEPKDYSEANMLFREGIMMYADGSYETAAEKMQEIEKKYPDYPSIKQVIINEGFFLWLAEKYPKTAATMDSYIELYQIDSSIPYVYFLKAMALHARKKSPTKEYYLIKENIESWNQVLIHDNGAYGEEAKLKILNLEEMAALHEIKVGDLYYSTGDYISAVRRFHNALKCQSNKYYVEAYKRLAKSYRKLRIEDQEMKYKELAMQDPNYEVPQELGFKQSIKNFLYDMVPDFSFLPQSMRVTS